MGSQTSGQSVVLGKRRRAPHLPAHILHRVFHHVWRTACADRAAPGPRRPRDMAAVVREFVAYSQVSATWAAAVLDRRFWCRLGALEEPDFFEGLPPPGSLPRTWNRLVDSFAPRVVIDASNRERTLGIVHGCEQAGRSCFTITVKLVNFVDRFELREHWIELLLQLRGFCSQLYVKYFTLLGGLAQLGPLPTLFYEKTAIGLSDIVPEGPFPRLEVLSLGRLWGGYTIYGDALEDTSRFRVLQSIERFRTPVVFPRLKFLGFSDDSSQINLDFILAVAPQLEHIYVSFSRSAGLGERTAFLYHDREFRLFHHTHFVHAHRWPGPRSGRELVDLWKTRMELCCDASVGAFIFREEYNSEMFAVVERRGPDTFSLWIDLDELVTTRNLHALTMEQCKDWWKPRDVTNEA